MDRHTDGRDEIERGFEVWLWNPENDEYNNLVLKYFLYDRHNFVTVYILLKLQVIA